MNKKKKKYHENIIIENNKMHLIFKNYIEKDSYKTIYFCMGCFWGAERNFWNVEGVVYTEVGYANPNTDSPSCGDVFRSNIFHREVTKVTYDNKIISLKKLLTYFFENHVIDTPANVPVPEPYKSSIFYDEKDDLDLINRTKELYYKSRLKAGKSSEITTQIIELKKYIKAKQDHQQYMLKHSDVFCSIRFNGIKFDRD